MSPDCEVIRKGVPEAGQRGRRQVWVGEMWATKEQRKLGAGEAQIIYPKSAMGRRERSTAQSEYLRGIDCEPVAPRGLASCTSAGGR